MKCRVAFPCSRGPSALQVACSPQNLVEAQPEEREGWASYFPPTSKAENYEFVMWRRAWHNPRRASWDPAPNLHLVMLDLGHNSIGILVSSVISCPRVHHRGAPCCSEAGRVGELGVWEKHPGETFLYSFSWEWLSAQTNGSQLGVTSAPPPTQDIGQYLGHFWLSQLRKGVLLASSR